VARALDEAFRLIPWPDEASLSARLAEARRPLDDLRVPVALARRGREFEGPEVWTLTKRRGAIYVQELGPTYILLLLLFLTSFLANRRPRALAIALALVFVAEAAWWSRRHSFDLGPIRPLAEQSPVLARVAAMPRGTRWVGPGRNLPMLVGSAPIAAYRTLDLPTLTGLTALAEGPPAALETAAALEAAGVGVRVVQGGERSPPSGWKALAPIDDPALLGWITGADWVRALGDRAPKRFLVQDPGAEPARAWFVSGRVEELVRAGSDPRAVLSALGPARPVGVDSTRPEDLTLTLETDRPGVVVLTQLWYPRWRAQLAGEVVPIARVFQGAQAVEIPAAGSWTLHLNYHAAPDRLALGASGLAWLAWVLLYWRTGRKVGSAGGVTRS
jgi:hypothetical protein